MLKKAGLALALAAMLVQGCQHYRCCCARRPLLGHRLHGQKFRKHAPAAACCPGEVSAFVPVPHSGPPLAQ